MVHILNRVHDVQFGVKGKATVTPNTVRARPNDSKAKGIGSGDKSMPGKFTGVGLKEAFGKHMAFFGEPHNPYVVGVGSVGEDGTAVLVDDGSRGVVHNMFVPDEQIHPEPVIILKRHA